MSTMQNRHKQAGALAGKGEDTQCQARELP